MFQINCCFCADAVNHAKVSLPERDEIDRIADIFKICADPTRVGILCALCSHSLCVCEIATVLNMSSSAISHQLRFLKSMGVISSCRKGKSMLYSIADNNIRDMFSIAFGNKRGERA